MPPNEGTNCPKVGRWICFTYNGVFEVKYKIIEYENREMEKLWVARKDTSKVVILGQAFLRGSKWMYIEEPSQEELDRARETRLGNHCGAVSISLKICPRCEAVRESLQQKGQACPPAKPPISPG